MHRIEGVAKDYAWGAVDAIPELLGVPSTGEPLAEMWFGAHHAGPAPLRGTHGDADGAMAVPAGATDLEELIAADTLGVLGADVLEHFGPRLPYLLKVIAPARPLSLQVHPSLERARTRFAQEEAAGLPPEQRSYADANHKPELVYALTTFQALSGFRAPRRAAELLRGLDAELANTLRAHLHADSTGRGMRAAFTHLLDEATRPEPAQVAELVEACRARLDAGSPSPRADGNVVRLHDAYPGDPGVVTSLLLNPVTLHPGEAMFVPAGAVHAYLSGTAVEIMASSDNVLRAGLTAKRMDVPEMLQCVDYVAAPPIRIAPERFFDRTRVYYAPVDDFELSVTPLVTAGEECPLPGRGPRILLSLGGTVRVRGERGEQVVLGDGQALFVRADDGVVTVERMSPADGATTGSNSGSNTVTDSDEVTPMVIQADVP